MHLTGIHRTLLTCCLILSFATPSIAADKLTIFILSGQSNMVGPAQHHTIASLYMTGKERDKQLAEMVFGSKGDDVSKLIVEQMERTRRMDELMAGRTLAKIDQMDSEPEKMKLKAALDILSHDWLLRPQGTITTSPGRNTRFCWRSRPRSTWL